MSSPSNNMDSPSNKKRPKSKSRRCQDKAKAASPPATSAELWKALFDEVKKNGESEHARALVHQLRRFAAGGDLLAQAVIDRAAVPC